MLGTDWAHEQANTRTACPVHPCPPARPRLLAASLRAGWPRCRLASNTLRSVSAREGMQSLPWLEGRGVCRRLPWMEGQGDMQAPALAGGKEAGRACRRLPWQEKEKSKTMFKMCRPQRPRGQPAAGAGAPRQPGRTLPQVGPLGGGGQAGRQAGQGWEEHGRRWRHLRQARR